MTEQKMLKEEARQIATGVQFELDVAGAKLPQFVGLHGRVQEVADRV